MTERLYSVNETFVVLKDYKITSNIESVRRWLRDGELEGIEPKSRKQGWQVTQQALDKFIATRLPNFNTTNVVISDNTTFVVLNEEQIRAKMWYEITSKNIWEGFVVMKKSALKEVAVHRKYSDNLIEQVWKRLVANSAAYKQPRVSYLLDAFSFETERILLDQNFASKEEQILYAIFEYVQKLDKKAH